MDSLGSPVINVTLLPISYTSSIIIIIIVIVIIIIIMKDKGQRLNANLRQNDIRP